MIYTISFCYGAPSEERCSIIRVRPFEYTSASDCAAQVSVMTPINDIGWYECEPQIVSQQELVQPAAGPLPSSVPPTPQPESAPTQSYAIFICKTGRACKQITQPLDPTDANCIDDILAVLGNSKYEVSNDRIYARGERTAWYKCARSATQAQATSH